jgi:putative peptide zinc metalloprotease protein
LGKRGALLELRAPFDGLVSEVTQGLDTDVWVGRDSLLLHMTANNGAVVAGLVNERESARLKLGAEGRFVPEIGSGSAVDGILTLIGNPGGEGIEFRYLASTNGGAIAVAPAGAGSKPMPISGVLPVRFAVEGFAPPKAQRGTLTAAAQPTSFLGIIFGRVVLVFLRESGF